MSEFGNQPPREMYDIADMGITCSECNTAIEKLPFQPSKREDGTYGKLYCYECNKKRYQNRDRGGYSSGNRF